VIDSAAGYLRRVSLLRDYSRQARTYDETRAASPSVLGPLREALDGAPGPRLVDVGGGTGNYSLALREEGWQPLVVDRQPEMLARAAAKGLETLQVDAGPGWRSRIRSSPTCSG
jgi:ubiquinone/menaquinone biosynthesis C-methylase UbiE